MKNNESLLSILMNYIGDPNKAIQAMKEIEELIPCVSVISKIEDTPEINLGRILSNVASKSSTTTDPNDPRLGHGSDEKPVPQNKVYLVLSDEEKKKGFVRPVRTKYIHCIPAVDRLKVEMFSDHKKKEALKEYGEKYVGILPIYDKDGKRLGGKYVTEEDFKSGGCGVLTKMGMDIAETYARDPKFYGSTYCVGCKMHLPVEEFCWDGTDEKVGS